MRKRILFVDDEAKILEGLQRMFRAMRNEWDMHFATGGIAALEILARESMDLVVSDMRMPGMNGLEFLTEVKEKYPTIIRIVLSGYADQLLIVSSAGVAHQYLSKPCDAEIFRSTVARALNLRAVLANDEIKRLIGRMSTLPSLPSLYADIVKELQSPNASIRRIGEIIAKDPGMTAKILQLANSAFFGLRRTISNPTEATTYLGLEIIQSLVLSLHTFTRFEGIRIPGWSAAQIWGHSIAAGALAKMIMEKEDAGRVQAAEAFTAGLLHDVGKLVLSFNMPKEYGGALAKSALEEVTLQEAERQIFGSTHAEVGAYLLGLWGLPDPIIEAVAMHHHPNDCAEKVFGTLAAVHAADALDREHSSSGEHAGRLSQLDLAYLDAIGKADRLSDWRAWCSDASVSGAVA